MAALAVVLATAGLALASCSGGSSEGTATTTRGDHCPSTASCASTDDSLKLNQIQVIGTHNSYHQAAPAAEHALLVKLNAAQAAQRTYSHPSITVQLQQQKVRQLELDVYADPEGGRYANPSLRRQAGLPPYVDSVPAMAKPGTKVLHEQDVDYHSVCPVFTECLREIKAWSDAHPRHVPIAIDVDFKDGPLIFAVPDQAKPVKWLPPAMDVLDGEIRSVFPAQDLITPDDVRGTHKTLEDSVRHGGWPTLGQSRGKVLFLMANGEPYRSIYLSGHPGLRGRILFTNAKPGEPDAAYVDEDDPVANAELIPVLVREGYLVRTRADSPDVQAKADDTSVLRAALASGAQWISTDYPGPDGDKSTYDNGYVAELPGFVAARCNPISAPKTCRDAAVAPGA